jgi:hypothetical protein
MRKQNTDITDTSVETNRNNFVLFGKKADTAIIVDIAKPLYDRLETTILTAC